MSNGISIDIGDRVVCINDELPTYVTTRHLAMMGRIKKGRIYEVTGIDWLDGEKGLHLAGIDHRPADGWRASRFRKVVPGAVPASVELPISMPCEN